MKVIYFQALKVNAIIYPSIPMFNQQVKSSYTTTKYQIIHLKTQREAEKTVKGL
jgi:hypothetical protein